MSWFNMIDIVFLVVLFLKEVYVEYFVCVFFSYIYYQLISCDCVIICY